MQRLKKSNLTRLYYIKFNKVIFIIITVLSSTNT